jgi:hypothetical protein
MLNIPEWQLEKSWAQHDPSRLKIPHEAWRGLRNFKRLIVPQHDRVATACASQAMLQKLMLDFTRKHGLGHARAFAKLTNYLRPAAVERLRTGILWTWLQPRGCILADSDDPGEQQDAILVRYGIGWGKRTLVCYLAFSLEIPDHCLARMIQRAPRTDLHAALRQAHHWYFAADAEIVSRHADEGSAFYLPCGPGLLIAEALRARTSKYFFVYGRCRTWISNELARADQRPIVAAAAGAPSQFELMTRLALESGQ